ncbi:GTP cyclohydrolase [Sediminitomix flava]|uniref:GTP cyclohydrolase n=1 Tax=Sediminitomix flava TaxID=379075 RepID=A0A315ZDU6_SEDFL|nr:GTP cyclohydrolase [Sediminitomix flava]PWJ42998.1 hypothetical protein BC781_102545 [Sediminitomix flava]
MEKLNKFGLYLLLFLGLAITSCDDDDDAPPEENELEVITDVKLIFTATDGTEVTARAQDPDGEGVADLEVLDSINLSTDTDYTLTFEILNNLDPNDPEDIGEEIADEDDEHQFFFSFTEDAFSDPTGSGNIDDPDGDINYDDTDDNGNPVGLSTSWTTSTDILEEGEFRVRLQHQPDIKSGDTGANDGDTDIDLTFVLNIE